MKTAHKPDQEELEAKADYLEAQCVSRGIPVPELKHYELLDNIDKLERALASGSPSRPIQSSAAAQAEKPMTATEKLQRAAELYQGLSPENRRAFLDRRGDEVRQLILDAETENLNQGNP